MSQRARPHHHLLGTLAWIAAAAAGLWPALPGVGDVVPGRSLTFVDLVGYSDGVLGAVAVVGLVGLVAALLHLLTAFDLWLDDRALRGGSTPGNWRAIRLGVPAALACLTLAFGGWTAYHHLRLDAYGNYVGLIEAHAAKSAEAWRRLEGLFAASSPSDRLKLPAVGGDPRPALREMKRSPVVAQPFHVSPDGLMTLLDLQGAVHVVDLKTWRAPQPRPFWPAMGPPAPGSRRYDPVAEQVPAIARATFNFTLLSMGGYAGFMPAWRSEPGQAIYGKGARRMGVLGYRLDPTFFGGPAEALLDELGLPATWEIGPVADNPYILPAPDLETGRLRPIRLVLRTSRDSAAATAHFQNTLMLLAALGVAFFAATIEAVRQFRSLIAERAMSMAQSSFVSGVSHEMRTPLATVRLYAELLEQGLDREPAQRSEFVGAILHEVDRLHRLIENVLDFARISGRKRTYSFVPTDLRALLDESVAAARGPLTAAGLEVEIHAPAPLSAAVDRDAIVQGLSNLLTNAAKYAPEGGRVWVSALPGPLGVTLAVQDFGPGIAREERAKVFRPFYRVAGTAAGGSGLGLSLVLEYARAHGGHVELESAFGQGATFRLHLPLDPTTAPVVRRSGPWAGALAALRRRSAA